jgi:hypothetical protein
LQILVFSAASLSVLLERPVDLRRLMALDDHEHDSRRGVAQLCAQVMAAVRFEKVRTAGAGVAIRAVISGVPNKFDILDSDEEEEPEQEQKEEEEEEDDDDEELERRMRDSLDRAVTKVS